MKGVRFVWFLVYVLFGLYFINYGLGFYPVPDFVSEFNNWIILAGGFMILFGGILLLRFSKRKKLFNLPQ